MEGAKAADLKKIMVCVRSLSVVEGQVTSYGIQESLPRTSLYSFLSPFHRFRVVENETLGNLVNLVHFSHSE